MILNFHKKTFIQSVQNLPDDIIREYIIPYTYELQTSELCIDIQNFHYTKHTLFELYNSRYPEPDSEQYEWLSNDITRFLNEDQGTIHGIVPFYRRVVSRLFSMRFKSNMELEYFIQHMELNDVSLIRDIMMKIGILLPVERIKLLAFIHRET